METNMIRTFFLILLLCIGTSASAQQATSSFQYLSVSDPMTDVTSEYYSATAGNIRVNFFCDQDGLNFHVSYDYMMIQSGASLTYRVGSHESSRTSFSLISRDGESAWVWGNNQFFNEIVPALQTSQSVLVQFSERVNGVHTLSLVNATGISQLSCAAPYAIEDALPNSGSGDTVESEPSKP